ncbi:MAG: hypothetical protein CL763_07785 [Chloroflexi bacterium]|nr:hypothetical protein [Chloroflexota bacterium]|tara:strand:- start:10329 stop:10964 length:636 start_codon:yes stop_codon:yes gene_type:complete
MFEHELFLIIPTLKNQIFYKIFMIILSQNMTNLDMELPKDAIFRINLAWINSLDELKLILEKHHDREIFLDLPQNRTKPPNNKYSMEEIEPILQNFSNIKYFAISNVDSGNDLQPFLKFLPQNVIPVPKIESPNGVKNIENISELLPNEKLVMLDHDDLFSKILKNNEDPNNFQNYIKSLIEFCDTNNVTLLRTIGVVFGDNERRTSDYVK